MDFVRIGIIGVGNMGSGHVNMFVQNQIPKARLTAVCDIRQERLDWAKSVCPDAAAFADAEALMDSGLVDAVVIATPHYSHPDLCRLALSKGLHVMSEKPAGVYAKAVRELIEYVRTQDKTYAIMFNQRTNCVYRKMKEIIASGELGEIRRVNWIITDWFRTQTYYDSGSWRATWDGEGGGVLLNQCPHNLDLWQWLCGMPTRLRAFTHNGRWHNIEVEDDVTVYAEYENGATGVFITSTGDYPGDNRLEVTLDGGTLLCDGRTLTLKKLATPLPEFLKTSKEAFANIPYETVEVETDGKNPQHQGVMAAFAEHILTGAPLVAEGCEGIRGLTISNAIHLSSWTGETVTLPLDEDRFLEELNRRRATSKAKNTIDRTFSTEGSYQGAKK